MSHRTTDSTQLSGAFRVTRRQCLGTGLIGGLSLAAPALAATAAPAPSPSAGRADALLVITLSGGLSQLDTFDPKPDAPAGIRSRFPVTPTALPGVHFTSLLPGLARRADRLAVIRSMTHSTADHDAAGSLLQTAVPLPVTPLVEDAYSSPTLSGLHPFASRISLADFDAAEVGIRMLNSEEQPSPRDLARYGTQPLGRRLLQARQLLEQGARCVHVLDEGWDHHAEIFTTLRASDCLPQLDRALSALLDDLEGSGLLSRTLVAVVTEFGRTPQLNRDGGRDHHPHAYTQLLAGGGIRGGQVVGATDATGATVVERPVTPADFAATVRYALHRNSATPDLPADTRPLLELF